ncbi:hypothetical protein ACHAQH_008081 [Verticillium albo-atrum]
MGEAINDEPLNGDAYIASHKLFLGTFIHSKSRESLEYLHKTAVCVDRYGAIAAIEPDCDLNRARTELFPRLEWDESLVTVTTASPGQFFFPGFIDTHVHASQYPNVGIFGKSTLLDWLNTYTFPLESSLKDLNKARRVYTACVRRTLAHGTTTSAYYATVDVPATNLLADICLDIGQRAFIGRVCMDHKEMCPSYYRDESAEASLEATKASIAHIRAIDPSFDLVTPILTPRFAPSCTSDAMHGLAALHRDTGLPIQTHISENEGEIALVKSMFPESASYAAVYDDHGLLTDRTVLAHAVHLSEDEADLVAARGAGVSHCPASNSALTSGAARVRWLWEKGVEVGLGTDMSGGYSPSVLEAARQASLVSRHVAMGLPEGKEKERVKLTAEEALFLGTRGGAKILGLEGEVGGFEVGKQWDAQLVGLGVVDGIGGREGEVSMASLIRGDEGNVDIFGWESWEDKMAKWLFNGDDRNTKKVWLPLGLLNAAQGHPMLVELKNGETLNGHLVMCDTWMNLTLKEVVQTSPEGDKFVKIPEVYVKGNNIKYLRVPDDIIDIVKENQQNNQGGFRGGRGGGRGDHRGGDRGSRIAFDGLWRCLCPFVDPVLASRVLNAPILSRTLHTATRRQGRLSPSISQGVKSAAHRRYASSAIPVRAAAPAAEHSVNRALVRSILNGPPATILERDVLPVASVSDLFEALRQLQTAPDSFRTAAAVVRHLVQDRGQQPTPALYECLIACARDTNGSADMIAQLLAEMRQLGINPGAQLCHDALEALAIHPNYLLRNEILWAMQESWTPISLSGHCNVALGLLRDGQYELAFDRVEELLDKNPDVPPRLLDVFVLAFAHRGYLDEAVRLAHEKRHATGEDIPLALWHLLLDACAAASHVEGTSYIWGRLLEHDRRRVPDGTLLAVLDAAARGGDPDLATGAMAVLTARGAKLGVHHYEALIDSYAAGGDVASALRLMCIMFKALGVAPEGSTRSIYARLKAEPALLDKALEGLAELVADYDVPLQALNVVVEATIAARGFDVALEVYKRMPRYTQARADETTFRHLLAACEDSRALRFLVEENPMTALRADRAAFDRAIYAFADARDVEQAFRCVELLGPDDETWLSRDTALMLVRRAVDAQDERVWSLLEEARRRDLDIESRLSRFLVPFIEGREGKSRREITSGRRVVEAGDEDATTL